MNVLLTGATGFTGSYVLRHLLDRGIRPRCLVRASTDATEVKQLGVEVVTGDIGDAVSLERAFRGIDTLLNTASLGFGHAPVLVSAAESAGIRRAVFVSTTAVFTTLNARSKAVRLAAEAIVQRSALDYTIIRPTMIYGSARDRNMARLIRFVSRWHVLPVAGDGERLQQPVYVDDVARALVNVLEAPATKKRAYNISGAAPLTFNQVIDTIAQEMQTRAWKIHIPLSVPVALLTMLERLPIRLPIRAEQLLRLNEDKAFDHAEAARDFHYSPLSFRDGIRRELRELGLLRPTA